MRSFPDRLPIGCHPDGRAPVFLYLVRAWDPFEFRVFLQRHGALLRALAEWRIRLLVPPHLEGAEKPHPQAPTELEELRWYFERQRELVVSCYKLATLSGQVDSPIASDYEQRYVAALRNMRAKGMFLDPPLIELLEQSDRDH